MWKKRNVCLIPCFAESCSARTRGPSDKSNPEMTSKSSEITRPVEGGGGARGYEPVDLRFGALRIYKYADQFRLYRPDWRRWLADRSRRERHTHTHVCDSRRLNIPDPYHDNNSVATVALFDWPRLESAGEIWVQIRAIYHVNVSALLRGLGKSRYLCVIENVGNNEKRDIEKNFNVNILIKEIFFLCENADIDTKTARKNIFAIVKKNCTHLRFIICLKWLEIILNKFVK